MEKNRRVMVHRVLSTLVLGSGLCILVRIILILSLQDSAAERLNQIGVAIDFSLTPILRELRLALFLVLDGVVTLFPVVAAALLGCVALGAALLEYGYWCTTTLETARERDVPLLPEQFVWGLPLDGATPVDLLILAVVVGALIAQLTLLITRPKGAAN